MRKGERRKREKAPALSLLPLALSPPRIGFNPDCEFLTFFPVSHFLVDMLCHPDRSANKIRLVIMLTLTAVRRCMDARSVDARFHERNISIIKFELHCTVLFQTELPCRYCHRRIRSLKRGHVHPNAQQKASPCPGLT